MSVENGGLTELELSASSHFSLQGEMKNDVVREANGALHLLVQQRYLFLLNIIF